MRPVPKGIPFLWLAGCFVAVLTGAAWANEAGSEKPIDASTIILGLPAELGTLQRPAVEFKHGVHTDALEEEEEGCELCHGFDDEERLSPKFKPIDYESGWDSLTNQYHDACMACHKERAGKGLNAGPITCGECHERRPAPVVTPLQPMPFTYSLHYRHILQMEEKCETCHHVYNEYADRLEYEKGEEDACRRCHGEVDDGDNLSLRNAAHVHCVACHFERQEQELEGGPVLCEGCHALEKQREIHELPEVARLMRGQKDQVWIGAIDARSNMVPFDHEAHEPRAEFCTNCHIQGEKIQACNDCHTLTGTETIEEAYHLETSEDTCVGCHKTETAKEDCAGCHSLLSQMPRDNSCTVCHSGPLAQNAIFAANAPFPPKVKLDNLLVHLRDQQATEDDFPETVIIDRLADEYEPVEMPHRSIVVRLDAVVRDSKLATQFHNRTETLCAGCHHHSPIGERPPSCASCHGDTPGKTRDLPGLEAAYHRQCIGCHQQMRIAKQGCTDCHAKAGEGEAGAGADFGADFGAGAEELVE